MSDPLQFASLTLEDDDAEGVANRGVITAETEETATFAAASSATHGGEDNAAIDDEPLAAPAAAPAASSFPDEPPPPYESIMHGTASAMVGYLEKEKKKKA